MFAQRSAEAAKNTASLIQESQKNAAFSEESASSAEELSGQASELASMVTKFKLQG